MPVAKTFTRTSYWSPARRFVTAVAAASAAIVWTHAAAAVLRRLLATPAAADAPAVIVGLTVAAALAALVGVAALPRRHAALLAALAGGTGVAVLELLAPGAWTAALALPAVAPLVTAGARRLGDRLPASLDGFATRHRAAAVLWLLVALVAVVQIGRLIGHQVDRGQSFVLTTANPFWHGHECLPAYLYGAELAARGDANLYAASHWPGLDPAATPDTRMQEMAVEDPYQYPPQFLLLPHLASRFSDHYPTVRTVWFALNLSLFVAAFAALALWVGGRAGHTALWTLPAVLASFPVLHDLQFGQVHLLAVAAAALAMAAFATRRRATGGALLAAAILAKMFPAVLLLPLLVRRRFRDLAWTAGFGVAFTVLALAVFGPAPFVAFFDHHLPRLGSGAAFAFDEAWPEVAELLVVDNQGAFGLARKLGAGKPAAVVVSKLFTVAVLAVAALFGWRRRRDEDGDVLRLARAAGWLALLGLASLSSPGAWGDYVPVTAVWLLALLAGPAFSRRRLAWALAPVAVLQWFLLGTMPIGDWAPIAVMLPVATAGLLSMLALFTVILAVEPRRFRFGDETEDEAPAEPELLARAA